VSGCNDPNHYDPADEIARATAVLQARVAELARERDKWQAKAIRDPSQLSKMLWSECYKMVAETNSKHMADAARLREALRRLLEVADFAPLVDVDDAHQRFAAARATLASASAPSAEPTPRDMRVAEAVREALIDAVCRDLSQLPQAIPLPTLRALDLVAVVAKAVKS